MNKEPLEVLEPKKKYKPPAAGPYMFWDAIHPAPLNPPPVILGRRFFKVEDPLSIERRLVEEFKLSYSKFGIEYDSDTFEKILEDLNNDHFCVYLTMLDLNWCNAERVITPKMESILAEIRAAHNADEHRPRL